MSDQNEYDDPEVQAVIRRKARARMLNEANALIVGRRHGEVAHLRNAAKHVDAALSEYDALAEPPVIAHSFAAVYDSIIERLMEIAKEEAEAEAEAAERAAAAGGKK